MSVCIFSLNISAEDSYIIHHILMFLIEQIIGIIPPGIDRVWPVLFLTVEIFQGGGVKVGVTADGDHGAVGRQEGEEGGGEEVGAQVVGRHHPLQPLQGLLSTSDP